MSHRSHTTPVTSWGDQRFGCVRCLKNVIVALLLNLNHPLRLLLLSAQHQVNRFTQTQGWLFPGNRDSFCSSVGRTDIVAIWRRLLHGDSGVAYTSFEFFASSLCARTVRYGQLCKDRAHGSDGTNDSPFSASITRVSYLVVFFGKPRCSRICSIAILLLFVFHLSFSFFLTCLLFSLVWEPFTNTAVSSGMNFSQGTWMPTISPAGQTADQIFAIDGYGTACLCIK